MDFKHILLSITASVLMVGKRTLHLALSPYKTMRKISQDSDMIQIGIIFSVVALYFFAADAARPLAFPPLMLFMIVIAHTYATILFFYFISQLLGSKGQNLRAGLFTFSYALIPTIIWFVINYLLFLLLPPPRTASIPGQAFSLVYITFSTSILIWKLILFYLAIRFSTKLTLIQIAYTIMLYVMILTPYIVFLYLFDFFRVPFI